MKKCIVLATFVSILTGCVSVHMENMTVGKSNPASEYCLSQKGFLDYVADKKGNTFGMCHLPNGQVVEEWELYRSNHK